VPLLLASITGPLVDLAIHAIRSLGLAGVLALTTMTGVIGLPGSEPTMLFAGFNVFEGHLTLLGIIVFGVIGDVLGACIAYAIGYFGSRELLEHQGSKLHVSPRGLDRAQRWFERRGAPVMLVSRVIPFVRSAFPYAAGVGRMPFGRFFLLSALGSVVWIAALGVVGRAVGQSWQTWRHHLEYADYAAVAIALLLIAYWVFKRRRAAASGAMAGDERADGQAAAVDAVSR
jgi:membrane protein DedA with SNARE-associated domain